MSEGIIKGSPFFVNFVYKSKALKLTSIVWALRVKTFLRYALLSVNFLKNNKVFKVTTNVVRTVKVKQ